MTKSVRHVGIVVKKISDLLPFYRDMLGLRVVTHTNELSSFISRLLDLHGCRLVTVKLAANGGETLIELLEFDSPSGKPAEKPSLSAPGITHIALTVKDLDSLYRKLSKHNIPFLSPPLRSPDGRVNVAFCRDPAGNYLELVEELP
jgi:catechol 2,3-dioxygenase-like lactoylglutathione lyase family enzyme